MEIPQRVIIFSGAGLSAESGISTFRGADGLWANYDVNDVCNFYTWLDNFDLVHSFYNMRRVELGTVEPNEAHKTIARIQQRYGTRQVFVITQNVDDLLERAGCQNVMHVHGELTKLRCLHCGYIWSIGYSEYKHSECPTCKHHQAIKPSVVFFYEQAPMYRAMHERVSSISQDDIIVVVGTSGKVVSISTLFMDIKAKGYKILNNLEPSSRIDEKLFDEIYYEPSTTAMLKIEQEIYKKVQKF